MSRGLLSVLCLLLLIPSLGWTQTLRIALREDGDLLDPTLARTYVGRIMFAGLCDKLFDLNEKLEIVPQLATGYEWTDPVTLIIHLRAGVTFHNGEILDAAAVKYTLERHLTLLSVWRRTVLYSTGIRGTGRLRIFISIGSYTSRCRIRRSLSPIFAAGRSTWPSGFCPRMWLR
jgi:ABC-type transport system substrate-binding protein